MDRSRAQLATVRAIVKQVAKLVSERKPPSSVGGISRMVLIQKTERFMSWAGYRDGADFVVLHQNLILADAKRRVNRFDVDPVSLILEQFDFLRELLGE